MARNSRIAYRLRFKEELTTRFSRLADWKQRLLVEDLECALENRLRVLERA